MSRTYKSKRLKKVEEEYKESVSNLEDRQSYVLQNYQRYINGKKIIIMAKNLDEANKLFNLLIKK